MNGEPVFEEVQSFTRAPLVRWALAAGVVVAGIVLASVFLTTSGLEGEGLGVALLVGGTLLPVVLTVGLMLILRLFVRVFPNGLSIRFTPFRERFISFEEIATAEARTYRPIREYGGWGIRYAGLKNRAYNVMGNEGVQLVLKDGERILLGSQRAQELEQAIRRSMG